LVQIACEQDTDGEQEIPGKSASAPANDNAANWFEHLLSTSLKTALNLKPFCGEEDFNSFLINDTGGMAPEPDFWQGFSEFDFLSGPMDTAKGNSGGAGGNQSR
jgi:hypothetical protein